MCRRQIALKPDGFTGKIANTDSSWWQSLTQSEQSIITSLSRKECFEAVGQNRHQQQYEEEIRSHKRLKSESLQFFKHILNRLVSFSEVWERRLRFVRVDWRRPKTEKKRDQKFRFIAAKVLSKSLCRRRRPVDTVLTKNKIVARTCYLFEATSRSPCTLRTP